MAIFDIFKSKKDNVDSVFDISKVSDDNVNQFLKSDQLKMIYILSPIFGGSEERGNQIIVTPILCSFTIISVCMLSLFINNLLYIFLIVYYCNIISVMMSIQILNFLNKICS